MFGERNEIIFPLKVKPLNDKGLSYDWTIKIRQTKMQLKLFMDEIEMEEKENTQQGIYIQTL